MPEFNPEIMEKKEKEPKLNFDFLFLPHETAEDARNIEPLLQKADIFAPEFIYNEEIKDIIHRLSEGTETLESAQKIIRTYKEIPPDSFYDALFELIDRHRKPVVLADYNIGDESLKERLAQTNTLAYDASKKFQLGLFEEAIQSWRKAIESMAKNNILDREQKYVEKLQVEIKKLLEQHSELKNKDELNILITFGAVHTTLYQSMKKEFPDSNFTRVFNEQIQRYSYMHEAIRRLLFDKQVNDELLARGLLEAYLSNLPAIKHMRDRNKAFEHLRRMASQCSYDQIKTICHELHRGEQLTEILDIMGIEYPKA